MTIGLENVMSELIAVNVVLPPYFPVTTTYLCNFMVYSLENLQVSPCADYQSINL